MSACVRFAFLRASASRVGSFTLVLLGKAEHLVKCFSGIPSDPGGQMAAVAKKLPLSYPVTPDWCDRVHAELERRGRGSQSRLAEFLDVSTSLLAEHIGGKYQTSDLVEGIHEYFGWVPPLPPTASLDAGELIHIRERLTPAQAQMLDTAAGILDGKSGDQVRVALIEMLKAFRAGNQNE